MQPDPEDLGPDQSFSRVVDLLGSVTDEDARRDEVPSDLWDRIAGRLSTADQPNVLAFAPEPTVLPDEPGDDGRRTTPVANGRGSGTVVELDGRRRQRWFRVAAAAAAVVIAAGTFGVISSNDAGTNQELVASVDLQPLKDDGRGSAELISVGDEQRIVITAAGLPDAPDGQHYEMWLIDPEVTDPRSLGQLPSDVERIEVPVPVGVDPDEFPIVDINLQTDGQVEHSGVETSVLRGTLA
jgi:hypothetical protein